MALAEQTTKYEDLLNQAGFGEYDFDYFSGSQLSIYIGDILVDEVVRLGYNFQHDKIPIFGYASDEADTIAWGKKIVQGEFAINYKEEAYLQIILASWLKRQGAAVKVVEGGQHGEFARENIENILRTDYLGNPSDNEAYKALRILESLYGFQDISQDSPSIGEQSPANTFEQVAEHLENHLWRGGEANLRGGDVTSYDQLTVPTHHKTPFNIHLVFGDYGNPYANHTSKRIRGVHLTGQAQTLILNGQPVFEVYPFIATGID
jgi:hypothetical protein